MSARIAELKACLERDIADTRADMARLTKLIKESEAARPNFATGLRKEYGRAHERLTHLQVTYDLCWPNEHYILQTLEELYREAPLH